MFPTILQIGPIKLHSYGTMIALGFLAALFLTQRDVKRANLDPRIVNEDAFIAFFIGLAGTRILHILMYPSFYSWRDPLSYIAIWNGGLVFQGAIPAAFVYAYYATKRRGVSFWQMGDIALPYVALAQAFGRVGCFLNGCCFGCRADHLPWAVRFPAGSPAYDAHAHRYSEFSVRTEHWSYLVHPTQIYSVLGLLAICGLLILLRSKWKPFTGFVMPLYFIFYGVFRFIIEFYRDDGNPTKLGLGYLSDQQVFCLIMIVTGVALFIGLRRYWARQVSAVGTSSIVRAKSK